MTLAGFTHRRPQTVRGTRMTRLAQDGGGGLMFKVHLGRLGKFLDPQQVAAFDGDEAWFTCEGTLKTPPLISPVATPAHSVPKEEYNEHPAR